MEVRRKRETTNVIGLRLTGDETTLLDSLCIRLKMNRSEVLRFLLREGVQTILNRGHKKVSL